MTITPDLPRRDRTQKAFEADPLAVWVKFVLVPTVLRERTGSLLPCGKSPCYSQVLHDESNARRFPAFLSPVEFFDPKGEEFCDVRLGQRAGDE